MNGFCVLQSKTIMFFTFFHNPLLQQSHFWSHWLPLHASGTRIPMEPRQRDLFFASQRFLSRIITREPLSSYPNLSADRNAFNFLCTRLTSLQLYSEKIFPMKKAARTLKIAFSDVPFTAVITHRSTIDANRHTIAISNNNSSPIFFFFINKHITDFKERE